MSSRFIALALVVCSLLLAAPRHSNAQVVYALTLDEHIETFDASAPGQMLSRAPITGLLPGTSLLAMDFRLVDHHLYALGVVPAAPNTRQGRLYRVQPSTGVATLISAANFLVPGTGDVGFDIDPVSDQIRVVTATRDHFRLDPATGTIIDGSPNPGLQFDTQLSATGVIAAAYGNNFAGTPFTTLYGINTDTNALVRIGGVDGTPSPNAGQVTQLGVLNTDVRSFAGLDAVLGDQLYAVMLLQNGETELLRINPQTGAATSIGILARPPGANPVTDIAVLNFPVTAFALTDDAHLLRFKTHEPNVILSDVAITGIAAGEQLLAIDAFPDGTIVGVGSLGNLFGIASNGVAAPLGPPESRVGHAFAPQLGLAVQPRTNTIRLIDAAATNLTIEERAFAPARVHTALSRERIVGIGYSGPTPTGQPPTLYGVDSDADVLVRIGGPQGAPSADGGEVTVIGPLNVSIDADASFDIDPASNVGYVIRRAASGQAGQPDVDQVWAVDLVTGAATPRGTLNTPRRIRGLALTSPGLIDFTNGNPTLRDESAPASVMLTVTRSGSTDAFAVDYATSGGSAQAGSDYTPVSGTLVFGEGETSKTFQIDIINDADVEFDFESIQISLTPPTAAVELGARTPLIIYILDDESPPNAPPSLAITTPTTTGVFEARTSSITIGGTAADDRGVVAVSWVDDRGRQGLAQGTTQWSIPAFTLEPGTTTITVDAHDVLGATNTATLTVTLNLPAEPPPPPPPPTRPPPPPPPPNQTFQRLLAEGATGDFFDLDVLLANPEASPADVTLTFLKEDGSSVTHARTLPPTSRTTVRVDDIAGMEATSASTVVSASHPVIVERTMRWDAAKGYYGAHTEKAVESTAEKWYFAEGSQGFFFTYLLLANPGAAANTATVDYLREGAPPITRTYALLPFARRTVDAGADPELAGRSFGMVVTFTEPGVAERAMYFGLDPIWVAGHESAGVTAPSTTWFLAEGATGSFFETFILLANPQTTAAEVDVTYLLQGGAPVKKTYTVPASGRFTINIEQEDPALANAAVGTQIVASVPIVAERAQYWPFEPARWYEAHNSFGVTATGRNWALAEGRVGGAGGYETFILLANPGATEAAVTITFLRTSGAPFQKTFAVPATSRLTVSTGANGPIPELVDEEFSAVIASTEPIVVERAMYSTTGGVTWSAGTNATATRLP